MLDGVNGGGCPGSADVLDSVTALKHNGWNLFARQFLLRLIPHVQDLLLVITCRTASATRHSRHLEPVEFFTYSCYVSG